MTGPAEVLEEAPHDVQLVVDRLGGHRLFGQLGAPGGHLGRCDVSGGEAGWVGQEHMKREVAKRNLGGRDASRSEPCRKMIHIAGHGADQHRCPLGDPGPDARQLERRL
jgi:hypothetical protein